MIEFIKKIINNPCIHCIWEIELNPCISNKFNQNLLNM